jgi:hypothetical protein
MSFLSYLTRAAQGVSAHAMRKLEARQTLWVHSEVAVGKKMEASYIFINRRQVERLQFLHFLFQSGYALWGLLQTKGEFVMCLHKFTMRN